MSNEIEPELTVEKAAEEARAGYDLFGQDLQPYSPSRKVAAQAMGMIYPFVPDSGQEQLLATGTYPGMLKDAVIVLWLCTLPDQQPEKQVGAPVWTPSRALRKPENAFDVALAWGEEQGMLNATDPKFLEAAKVFMAIVSGVAVSEFDVQVEGSEASDDSSDPKV